MAEAIKYYLDEHVPRAVPEGLRRRGVDVLSVREASKLGEEDAHHLELALQDGRVIVTQDADFLCLHAEGHRHAGIVYASRQTRIGSLVRGLMLIHDALAAEDMTSHVEFL